MHAASTRATRLFAASAFLSAVLGCLATLAWLDVFAAGILFRGPLLLLVCAPLVGAALLLLRRERQRWMTVTGVAAAVVAIVLLVAPWHPRKRFARTLDALAPGMTVAAVQDRMQPYLRGAGPKWEQVAGWSDPSEPGASFDGTLIWRWNDRDWQYDSDFGEVTFVRGRVAAAAFLPD